MSLDLYDLDGPEPTHEDFLKISHIGRVIAFRKTYINYPVTHSNLHTPGNAILKIEEAFRPTDIRLREHACLEGVEVAEDELVLSTCREWHIGQDSIIDFCV
ncbi:hypothetical protein QQZ08_001205 [Neonectria magnoliae]|uniref:Uncharacterized protein n=1 Tax=Neonectria magnoliae TaxID=2732573 RepID=A0ABR1IGS4_9HYPO